ncbi:MAG: response regulator transcription factor [Planctomycetota bacterium]|jgi:DNA-binding response OmpR family regulator
MLDQFLAGESAGAIATRILVVEDDADQAAQLRDLLQENGYQVRTAKDGGQAHSSFQMYKPDFVILDLILPGGESGFEICERMKQWNEAVPVLVLTEITLDDARGLATRVGADGYMTKPYDPAFLLSQITEIAQEVWERTHLGQSGAKDRVRFQCRCGKKFKLSQRHRGRTMTCPDCGDPLVVPFHD